MTFTFPAVCVQDGKDYYRVDDFLRDKAIDELPAFSDSRSKAFRQLVKVSLRLESRLAKQAFPELSPLPKLPTLWASWNEKSAKKWVKFRLSSKNYNRLCS